MFVDSLFFAQNKLGQTIFQVPLENNIIRSQIFEWIGWYKLRYLYLAQLLPESSLYGIPEDVLILICFALWNECFTGHQLQPARYVHVRKPPNDLEIELGFDFFG